MLLLFYSTSAVIVRSIYIINFNNEKSNTTIVILYFGDLY